MSPSGSVTRCDSCGQEKVTTQQDGRRLCLTCLRRADAGPSPSAGPSPLSGFIEHPLEERETSRYRSQVEPAGGATRLPVASSPQAAEPSSPKSGPSAPPGTATYHRRRARRGVKWLIIGAVGLCVGGALLAIVLTHGTSGLVRFFRGFLGR